MVGGLTFPGFGLGLDVVMGRRVEDDDVSLFTFESIVESQWLLLLLSRSQRWN